MGLLVIDRYFDLDHVWKHVRLSKSQAKGICYLEKITFLFLPLCLSLTPPPTWLFAEAAFDREKQTFRPRGKWPGEQRHLENHEIKKTISHKYGK